MSVVTFMSPRFHSPKTARYVYHVHARCDPGCLLLRRLQHTRDTHTRSQKHIYTAASLEEQASFDLFALPADARHTTPQPSPALQHRHLSMHLTCQACCPCS